MAFLITFSFVASLANIATLTTNIVYKKSTQYRKYIWLDSSKFTDFIIGHDESTLEVGHAGVGINAGGITDGINSVGVAGCTGKLIITPPLKKGDIE